jgi:hypothetical protein
MARKKTKPKDSFDESELPAEGAVLAFQLSDGRWGACRVLRKLPIAKTELGEWSSKKVEGWCLRVAVTPWVGKKLPHLKEPLLREILALTHHSWTGRKEVALVACPPDAQFEYVGVLPTTDNIAASKRHRSAWRLAAGTVGPASGDAMGVGPFRPAKTPRARAAAEAASQREGGPGRSPADCPPEEDVLGGIPPQQVLPALVDDCPHRGRRRYAPVD